MVSNKKGPRKVHKLTNKEGDYTSWKKGWPHVQEEPEEVDALKNRSQITQLVMISVMKITTQRAAH